MTELIVAFRNFANAPKKGHIDRQHDGFVRAILSLRKKSG